MSAVPDEYPTTFAPNLPPALQPPGYGIRVAVVTDYFPDSAHPWNGHSAYQTLRMIARLAQVHVFYPQITYPAFPHPDGETPIDRSWNPPDVWATYIPFPAVPAMSRPLNGFSSAWKLLPHVRRFKPDVILNYAVYPYGFAAVLIARKLGVPVLVTAIGSDLNRIPDPLCGFLARWTLRHASYVNTVSHDLRATAIRMGAHPDRVRAKLNGCDTSIFHPMDRLEARRQLGLDPAAEIVLYVGRLDLRKGLRELIEATAMLRSKRPRVHTYILGDGPDRPSLVEAIAAHDISSAVTLAPPVLTSGVAQWMAAADLVTLPSYAEGCPNVILEALSAGRPVVASNVGGIPEILNDSFGRLVPARDPGSLSVALDQVLSLPWDAQAIADGNSRDWTEVGLDLLECFDEMAHRR